MRFVILFFMFLTMFKRLNFLSSSIQFLKETHELLYKFNFITLTFYTYKHLEQLLSL